MISSLILEVRRYLTPDLLKPEYHDLPFPTGHCYVATESLWHLLGDMKTMFVPAYVSHEGITHWFLKQSNGSGIIDATADQFRTPVPYHLGKSCGFLTREPSRRAQQVMSRMGMARSEL
jgi:hypothetical protein